MTKTQIRGTLASRWALRNNHFDWLRGYRVIIRQPDGITKGPYYNHPEGWKPVVHGVTHTEVCDPDPRQKCGAGVNFFPDLGSAVVYASTDAISSVQTRKGDKVEVWEILTSQTGLVKPNEFVRAASDFRTVFASVLKYRTTEVAYVRRVLVLDCPH